MFPSLWLRGRLSVPTDVDAQAGTLNRNWRRQRPSWMTTGMLVPAGTLASVNVPSKFVYVDTSGEPDTSAPHWRHDAPGVKTWSGALGTKTRTFGTGSGANPVHAETPADTVPVIVVFAPPSQLT